MNKIINFLQIAGPKLSLMCLARRFLSWSVLGACRMVPSDSPMVSVFVPSCSCAVRSCRMLPCPLPHVRVLLWARACLCAYSPRVMCCLDICRAVRDFMPLLTPASHRHAHSTKWPCPLYPCRQQNNQLSLKFN